MPYPLQHPRRPNCDARRDRRLARSRISSRWSRRVAPEAAARDSAGDERDGAHAAYDGRSPPRTSTLFEVSFLGGGSYDHFIPGRRRRARPAVANSTPLTRPIRPKSARATFQVVFEYHRSSRRLTGLMYRTPASMTAAALPAEAVLMAISSTNRYARVVVGRKPPPRIRQTMRPPEGLGVEVVTVGNTIRRCDTARIGRPPSRENCLHRRPATNFFGASKTPPHWRQSPTTPAPLVVSAFRSDQPRAC